MIVVAGEALVDLVPTPAGDLRIHPGGGPFNTARWLGRLGADVAFLGAIAADPLGQRLREQLVAAGVSLDLAVATQLPTTLALAQLDAAGAAQYSFYANATSIPDVRPEQVQALLPPEFDALVLGSIGLMLEPAASAGLRAVELARQRGAPVMVDPNVRPTLIADRERYLRRLGAVIAEADVVKLSVEDAAWLYPGEPPQAAARALLAAGPAVVLLTAGAAGATVLTAGAAGATVLTAAGATAVPAIDVAVVDTIGAGDAFSAGFLVRWLRDRDAVVEAARFATRVAGLACSLPGATPPADLGALAQAD